MAHNSVSFHLTTQIMFAVHARDFAWSCRMGGLARDLRENMLKGDLVSVCVRRKLQDRRRYRTGFKNS